MGNYRCRRDGFILGWQQDAALYMFQGKSDEEITRELWFKFKEPAPNQLLNGKRKLQRLRKDPKFQEYYKSIVTEWSVRYVGKAMNKLGEQLDCDQPWLANKAANDVLNHAKKMVLGEDENTIHVHVEGMPEIGSPDSDG